jgi:membrane glycosyltransferase
MLALPRVLGVLAVMLRGELAAYGGAAAMVKGALLEGALSVLQAPLRMAAHSVFVAVALTGWKLDWKSPPREAEASGGPMRRGRFAPLTALVALVLAGALALHRAWRCGCCRWRCRCCSPRRSRWLTSWSGFGERIRAAGLLVTPEESRTPGVLRRAWARMRQPALALRLVGMPLPDHRRARRPAGGELGLRPAGGKRPAR